MGPWGALGGPEIWPEKKSEHFWPKKKYTIFIYKYTEIIYEHIGKSYTNIKNLQKIVQNPHPGREAPRGPAEGGPVDFVQFFVDLFTFVYDFPICLYMISVYLYMHFVYFLAERKK